MKSALWVLRKELKEMLRDKRVVFGAFVMPALMIVFFIYLMGWLQSSLGETAELTLVVVGESSAPILEELSESDRTNMIHLDSKEEAYQLVQDGDAELAIEVTAEDGRMILNSVFDSRSMISSVAASALRRAAADANKEAVRLVLETNDLNPDLADSVTVAEEDAAETATEGAGGGAALAGLLPYLIVIWAFYGGFGTASDTAAGEKERGTLETLFTAPSKRNEIVLGKLGSLFFACLLSAGASLIGIALAGVFGFGGEAFAGGMSLSPKLIGLSLLVLLPLVFMFSGALLTISAAAKSVRESQAYLTGASFLVITPAVMSQFIGMTGADGAGWVVWTPILNSAVSLTGILKGQTDMSMIGASVACTALLGTVFWIASLRLFSREQILNRS